MALTLCGRWPLKAFAQPDSPQAHLSGQKPLGSPAQRPWLGATLELQDVPQLPAFSSKHLAGGALDGSSHVKRLLSH